MIDLIIRNTRIYDGTGGPPIDGDLVIEEGRIASVGEPAPAGAAVEELDLGGLAIAPGFIDLHTHSDVSLLSDPGCISAIEQGVTTQAVGLCGFSAGPLSPESLQGLIDEEPVFAFPGVDWSWTTIGGYREAVERARPATNVTTFVGHNTLRRFVVGGANRPPTAAELQRMRSLVREAIDQGARGFTTGLSYAPGLFASVEELAALAGVAADRGLAYHTHMRYGDLGVRRSVEEALDTAERAGVTLNISHMYPRANEPLEEADVLLGMLDEARARGVEVTFDLTIFPRGGGAWVQSLPGWARDGGSAATQAVIRDPESRARLVEELSRPDADFWMANWDDQVICKVNRPEYEHLTGRTVGELARERGQEPIDTALDLVLEDGQFWIAPTIKDQGHLDRLISSPLCVPIGDGFANHPEKHRAYGLMPKSFGTFPLVLGSYVRDRGVLTLEEAVRKISAEPARRLGLADRGVLAPGFAADLVVFDTATIANRATEADPAARPAGIERVMVNGEWVVVDGRATGARPGRSL
ncbi:MAG TPA: D-aminoacylase [Candidatus Limnocylindrales bacterium]|nr:D-aminoacylase [Candidatus Limnocylindrales bacterium]